jgi:predicted secreted hydrolase
MPKTWMPATSAGMTKHICKIAVLAALVLARPFAGSANAQGFSDLGTEAQGFARVLPGRTLSFPADHGAHPDFRIEWWYLTANLRDASGVRYGVQWTLFRQAGTPGDHAEGFASRQLWMGHAALTSADTHRFAERFARGGVDQAGVTAAPLLAFIDDWRMAGAPDAAPDKMAPLRLSASGKDFSYALTLTADRPLVLQGEGGFSRKSARGQASYYYSQPFLRVAGSLVVDGRTIDVSGEAWFDHEWSSQPLAADQTGWDWFSLHLSSGAKLMLFRLRQNDGAHFIAGTYVGADGASAPLDPADIVLTPGATTPVAGRDLPTSWRIAIRSRNLALEATPLNPRSWMGTRYQYWEGPITVSGSETGVGYLELTGYRGATAGTGPP